MKPAARAKTRPATRTKKARTARAEKHTRRKTALTPAEKVARDLIAQAMSDVTFVHAAIRTELAVEPDGFHVRLDIFDRETGDPVTIDLRWDLPPFLISRDHALDWIYACAREAWVHELNEALFVDGVRRRDLHNDRGQTILPPDEAAKGELNTFKMQLAAFLMGAPR